MFTLNEGPIAIWVPGRYTHTIFQIKPTSHPLISEVMMARGVSGKQKVWWPALVLPSAVADQVSIVGHVHPRSDRWWLRPVNGTDVDVWDHTIKGYAGSHKESYEQMMAVARVVHRP